MSNHVLFYELCRLCLENAGVCNVLESSNLLEDIYVCTGVQILPSDNLPPRICGKCLTAVQDAKALRVLAKKNDAHLRCLFDMNCCDEISKNDRSLDDVSILEKVCGQVNGQNGTHSEKKSNEDTNYESKTEINMDCSEDNVVTPIIVQTISIRKDLFYSSSPSVSPKKRSKTEEDKYAKLLKAKVKAEQQCRPCKINKSDDDMKLELVCGICYKEFENAKKFYLHQRLHNKKYCCPFDICGKKFATKGDLQKHTRTHTGERPYECHICSRSFTQNVTLRSHLASVHSTEKKDEVGD